MTPKPPPPWHFKQVAGALLAGSVVPLLGAGASLCDRPAGEAWEPGRTLPTGAELGAAIAEHFGYQGDDTWNLPRVAQFAESGKQRALLVEQLRTLFAPKERFEPTSVHRFLARVPAMLRGAGSGHPHQLIVTTNYDDALERAFQEQDEDFDLVFYNANPERNRTHGRFWHLPPGPGAEARPIERANTYDELELDERTIILKIHGLAQRLPGTRSDSYVISEDDYIEYLASAGRSSFMPKVIMQTLVESHFLFMGYSLGDWNLRVLLHQVWERQRSESEELNSWAVQLGIGDDEAVLWEDRGIRILNTSLPEYVGALATEIERQGSAQHAA
jgi:hypothetical protein